MSFFFPLLLSSLVDGKDKKLLFNSTYAKPIKVTGVFILFIKIMTTNQIYTLSILGFVC